MAKGAKDERVRLFIRAGARGALMLSLAFTQAGCHRKRSDIAPPRPTSSPAAPAAPPSSASAAGLGEEPYWSPSHVLVLPKSTDALDDSAAREVVEKSG